MKKIKYDYSRYHTVFMMYFARLFGESIVAVDSGYAVVAYKWLGRFYIEEIFEVEPNELAGLEIVG